MPLQRISHSKSRYGCVQCKQRRLKCDELRPRCKRCDQVGRACSFQEQLRPDSVPAGDTIANVEDMFLLHNFIVSSKSFTVDDSPSATAHESPIAVAFKHHYLLHAILGLSALQLYTTDRAQSKWYQQATSHQDAAIRQARPHLSHTAPEHAEAIFWFSSFTSMFALAEPPIRPSQEGQMKLDATKELLHAFGLARGIRMITHSLPEDCDIAKATAPELWQDNRDELRPTLREDYPALLQLEEFIEANCEDSEQLFVCLTHVEELLLFIAVLQHAPTNRKATHLIMSWCMGLPAMFLDMCSKKASVAVATLAFYGVAMHTRQEVWFFRGWPEILLTECEEILKDKNVQHGTLLDWPRMVIRGT